MNADRKITQFKILIRVDPRSSAFIGGSISFFAPWGTKSPPPTVTHPRQLVQ